MPGDGLFEALAQARALPSKAFRTTQAALDIPGQALEGLETGLKARNDLYTMKNAPQMAMAQRQATLLDNYGKLYDSIGPDALRLMGPSLQSAGVDISKLSSESQDGTLPTPAQLAQQGKYGKTKLDAMKIGQDIENQAPYTPEQVRGMLSSTPDLAEGLIKANPNGSVPYRQVQAAIAALRPAMMGPFFQGRLGTMQAAQLPSEAPINQPAGAAAQVKMAARQGKALIAKATTPQSLQLASVDLSRAVQRAAPVAETIGAGNYGQSLPTLWGQFTQKLTADPTSPDVPKLRKQLYDTFDELDKAATPFIVNRLQNMEDNQTNSTYGKNWANVRNRELGLTIPEIPFQETSQAPTLTSAGSPNTATGVPQVAWKTAKNSKGVAIRSKDNWATFEPVQGGQ